MLVADPARLQAGANADPEFRLAAPYWNATLSLESPTRVLRVEIAEGRVVGHFPMCENPARFREYILPVLDEIRARR